MQRSCENGNQWIPHAHVLPLTQPARIREEGKCKAQSRQITPPHTHTLQHNTTQPPNPPIKPLLEEHAIQLLFIHAHPDLHIFAGVLENKCWKRPLYCRGEDEFSSGFLPSPTATLLNGLLRLSVTLCPKQITSANKPRGEMGTLLEDISEAF